MISSVKIRNFIVYDKRLRAVLFFVGLFSLILLALFLTQYFRPKLLKVSFYDIGQGDAIFIETPERYQVLIDGGPGSAILKEIAKDMPFYDRTIDLLVATHPDADHIAGLVDVLERYTVKAVVLPRVTTDTKIFERLLVSLKNEGASIKEGQGLQKFKLPGEVTFAILNPLEGQVYKNKNNEGIVSLIGFGDVEFLLLADVSKDQERELLPLLPQGIEVVKVGHHGSKSSTDREFFEAVSPELSVIQVGKDNRYGHPTSEVLSTLQAAGSLVWRTDRQGTLTLLSDGKEYWVQ